MGSLNPVVARNEPASIEVAIDLVQELTAGVPDHQAAVHWCEDSVGCQLEHTGNR